MRTPDKWEYDDERVDAISQIRASAYTQDDADLIVPGYVVTKILATTPLLLGDAASCWPTSLRNTDEYCLRHSKRAKVLVPRSDGTFAMVHIVAIVHAMLREREADRDYSGNLRLDLPYSTASLGTPKCGDFYCVNPSHHSNNEIFISTEFRALILKALQQGTPARVIADRYKQQFSPESDYALYLRRIVNICIKLRKQHEIEVVTTNTRIYERRDTSLGGLSTMHVELIAASGRKVQDPLSAASKHYEPKSFPVTESAIAYSERKFGMCAFGVGEFQPDSPSESLCCGRPVVDTKDRRSLRASYCHEHWSHMTVPTTDTVDKLMRSLPKSIREYGRAKVIEPDLRGELGY